jgi:hypothetical protein
LTEISDFKLKQLVFTKGISLIDITDERIDTSESESEFKYCKLGFKLNVMSDDFVDYMKFYCENYNPYVFNEDCALIASKLPDIPKYYNMIGKDRIKALKYEKKNLKNEIKVLHHKSILTSDIHSMFNPGDRVTNAEVKERLQTVYDKYGLKMTAKATDISDYFYTTVTKVQIKDRRADGYVLNNRKYND